MAKKRSGKPAAMDAATAQAIETLSDNLWKLQWDQADQLAVSEGKGARGIVLALRLIATEVRALRLQK